MQEKEYKKKKNHKIKWIVTGIILVFLIMMWEIYIHSGYKADNVSDFLNDTEIVQVSEITEGWFFDGPGEEALIFYPGALVEPTSYAPLMQTFAEEGIDCYLIRMHDNLAFFGVNTASDVIKEYQAEKWYLGGHSLGGAMAASFASKHSDELDGLVLLGSYTASELNDAGFPVITIYGSEDCVLNRDKLAAQMDLLPIIHAEMEIDGGNHSGFAFYGPQKGDGEATISKDEQISETVSFVLYTLGKVE